MNSFEIPRLAGQIYAMAGMRTKLNLIADVPGDYHGLSTNFSGDGFSDMRFEVRASSQAQFDEWVNSVQHAPKYLTLPVYDHLVLPTEHVPVEYFSHPAGHLFNRIIMKYRGPDMHRHNEVTGKKHA